MTPDQFKSAKRMTPAAEAAGRPFAAAMLSPRHMGGGASYLLRWSIVLFIAALSVACPGRCGAQGKSVGEYELKAALLPKFPLFIKWPDAAFAKSRAPLVIGVLGVNPFGEGLESAVKGKVVDGHPLEVRACRDVQEASRCHIVFVAGADPKAAASLAGKFSGTGVLVVGDVPGFGEAGGMVNLVTENRKISLEVNLEAIQSASLRIDPQLLKLAKVVKTTSANPGQ